MRTIENGRSNSDFTAFVCVGILSLLQETSGRSITDEYRSLED